MSIEMDLKKEGIKILKPLDTLKVNSIARKITNRLTSHFPDLQLDENKVFIQLSRINMYIAEFPDSLCNAKYYYKNSSIYFKNTIPYDNLEDYAIHECIHHLQEKKDSKNNLIGLGLCSDKKLSFGIAINEAAVQYISSKCMDLQPDTVKYYDITFPTISPFYYALECNLIAQMASITGEACLVKSTLENTSAFQDKFIRLTNEDVYLEIVENMDSLMYAEDALMELNEKRANCNSSSKTITKLNNEIAKQRKEIQNLFIHTQNLIFRSYFNSRFQLVFSLEGIEQYRSLLYHYRDFIGFTDNYTYFNDYYIEKMAGLEIKYEQITNPSLALTTRKSNILFTLFRKIRKLFGIQSEYEKISKKDISY